jgi:K(+)-stimulated pyrophosphate-energized sodium pump
VEAIPYLAALSALAGLLLAGYYYTDVKKASPGDERMVFLMTEIQKGAKAFLQKEYQWVAFFAAAMAILLAIVIAPLAAVTYLLGATSSIASSSAPIACAPRPSSARTAHQPRRQYAQRRVRYR